MSKIILDLCGGTGSWSKPYREAGYDVRVVSLPDQDVRLFIPPDNVHGILAAPPCTEFSTALNMLPWRKRNFLEGLSVVDACVRIAVVAKPKWWALENPTGLLGRWLGKPRMTFQPWQYGDPWKKRTAIWGFFTPPPKFFPVAPTHNYVERIVNTASKKKRAELAAITPSGFARAFFEANP